jgi:hypothetical protein
MLVGVPAFLYHGAVLRAGLENGVLILRSSSTEGGSRRRRAAGARPVHAVAQEQRGHHQHVQHDGRQQAAQHHDGHRALDLVAGLAAGQRQRDERQTR